MIDSPWPHPVKLAQVSRLAAGEKLERRLVAGEAARTAVAELLEVEAVERLEAGLWLSPWFDGMQIEGRWRAAVVQVCGVSLEPFQVDLDGRFMVRAVPEGSALAPREGEEIVVDPDADDPPDVVEGDSVDLGGYVVEHLALEIDPFPRKPGAAFVQPGQPAESSPFDVLRALKDHKPT